MDTTDYMSVSKACSIKDYSVKKVLTFLADKKVIPKESQRKGMIFEMNNGIDIISTGESLKVKQDQFYDYLDREADLSDLAYTDYNKEILDMVADPKIRFDRIREIKNKRLMFIDAEFKEGNYHEIAWELWEGGKLIEKRYILEKAHFLKRLKNLKEYSRYTRLKKHNQHCEILPRKQINYILKGLLKTVDFIIAHNAYGERNILIKNGMWYEKAKYLCTSKMSENFIGRQSPSLMDLVNYYAIKYDSHFTHYAHEDARMTAMVFFQMIDDAEKKLNDKT